VRFILTQTAVHQERSHDRLNHNYITFLEELNIKPILLPNSIKNPELYVKSLEVQGIILTGGNDVSPNLYRQEVVSCKNISPIRDEIETKLIRLATKDNIPILGICRGMQIINVFFGGSLIQNIKSILRTKVNHVDSTHLNKIVNPKIVKLLGNSEFTVNSFHDQGIVPTSLAKNLKIFSVSKDDGIIEGFFHKTYPIIGIQWHPERLGSTKQIDINLIKVLLGRSFWKNSESSHESNNISSR